MTHVTLHYHFHDITEKQETERSAIGLDGNAECGVGSKNQLSVHSL